MHPCAAPCRSICEKNIKKHTNPKNTTTTTTTTTNSNSKSTFYYNNIMSNIMKKMWCCGAKGLESNDLFDESDVPEGHVRVYVGKDEDYLCKFEMEADYLNHPLFENLLRLSEEEFGFSYGGALRIACEIDVFRYLVHLLKTSNPSAHYMELPDLVSKVHSDNTARKKQNWPSR